MKKNDITIIGAGLVGSLLSILLAKRGFRVTVFEQRPDLRTVDISAGRSINLALASRGIYPLEQAGVMDKVRRIMLPMRSRMIHSRNGEQESLSYGQRPQELIYSVSRGDLNSLLLDEAEATGLVQIHFNHRLKACDIEHSNLHFEVSRQDNNLKLKFDQVIGTDGSNSILRDEILKRHDLQAEEDDLSHAYKELNIPPTSRGEFAMESESLHIWPRNDFMQIALPNPDRSFTVTLFMAKEGQDSFADLSSPEKLADFYGREFADSVSLMPAYQEDFFKNPLGKLSTIKCARWNHGKKALILGDAAHAIVPFHGQGMNCGFEDCWELVSCLDKGELLEDVFARFTERRKPNSDAIAYLALDNYHEMRSGVIEAKYQLKKQLAFELERTYPNRFIPRYSMVMFHRMPYKDAMDRGQIQKELLESSVSGIDEYAQIDLASVKSRVLASLPELAI